MTKQTGLTFHSTVVFVRDIEVAKKFYLETLGLAVETDLGKNVELENGITLWEIFPQHIIPELLGSDSIGDRSANRFEFYFESEDVEPAYEKVKASGTEFLHALHEEPWGQKTFRFFDPDRHLIEVGESLETFVKRHFQDNMTPEQVAQRTFVPLEKVREILKV
jgi:catechol 2,3-dioxygenase-like lactoylglutathione lyase family enzyme